MRSSKFNPIYKVPVLVQSPKDKKFEVVNVLVSNFQPAIRQTQSSVKVPKRVVMVEGSVLVTNEPNGVTLLDDLLINTNWFGLSTDKRQLENRGHDADGYNTYQFKMSATLTERVLKAVYLFGFLTTAQYRAAVIERQRLCAIEWANESAEEAERELLGLIGPDLPLAKAKKLIDGLVRAQKVKVQEPQHL